MIKTAPTVRSVFRFTVVMILATLLLAVAIWRGAGTSVRVVHPGEAAAGMLAERSGLFPLPALDAAAIPMAGEWDFPLGTANGAFTYNAQPFLAQNPGRGGLHLGDDLNGIGWEDTDLNDPVFSVADGVVAYAGEPSPGWAGLVVLLHRCAMDGSFRQSFYGHLDPAGIPVVPGQQVPRGRLLGRLGHAQGSTFAHLHFEVREGLFVEPGPGYTSPDAAPLNRVDPDGFLRERSAGSGRAAASRVASLVRGLRVSGENGP